MDVVLGPCNHSKSRVCQHRVFSLGQFSTTCLSNPSDLVQFWSSVSIQCISLFYCTLRSHYLHEKVSSQYASGARYIREPTDQRLGLHCYHSASLGTCKEQFLQKCLRPEDDRLQWSQIENFCRRLPAYQTRFVWFSKDQIIFCYHQSQSKQILLLVFVRFLTILRLKSLSSRIFSGLRSLCTIQRLCIHSRAFISYAA